MSTPFLTYKQRLDADFNWGLNDTCSQFAGRGSVLETMRKLVKHLDDLQVPYAIAGSLAGFHHGYRRVTTNVNVLVTNEHHQLILRELIGNGYQLSRPGGRNLYDSQTGVLITFLTTGDYPGDDKPKPVSFPDPKTVRVLDDGIWYLELPALVELKLASGMSNPGRGKDLVDVQELVTRLQLDESFATKLNPYVQEKYLEVLDIARTYPSDQH
jgi:hypothetical protein